MIKKIDWKKIFYIFIFFFLIFLIYNNFSFIKKIEEIEEKKREFNKSKIYSEKKEKDTDGDGLFDWEEILYGTDFELKDTDGDGYDDFWEIENQMDPLVPGNGKKEDIEKISLKTERVLTIKESQNEFEKIKKELKEKNKKIEELNELKLKGEKIKKELEFYRKEIEKEKEILIDDLNLAANVLNFNTPVIKNALIESFISYFYPDFEGDRLTEENIKIVEEYILNTKILSEKIKNMKIKDSRLRAIFDSLSEVFFEIYENFENLLVLYKEEKKEGGIEFVENYIFIIEREIILRRRINEIIEIYNLDIKESDPASVFLFSF